MALFDVGIILTAINRTKAAFAQVRGDMDKLDRQAAKTRRGFRAIDAVFASIAAGSAISLSKRILDVATSLEQTIIRLAVFERGLEPARKRFGELIKQFGRSGFEIDTVVDGFTRLAATGVKDVPRALQATLDAVAAFGGGTQELQRVLIGLQQIGGKGTLQMEELRQQLGEAVPFALKIMAEQTNRTIPEFIEAVSRGAVSSKEALDAFFIGAEQQFGGFTEVIGKTLQGAQAGLANAWQGLINRVFVQGGINTRIGIVLDAISTRIQQFTESLSQADVDRFAEFLKNIVRFGVGAAQAVARLAEVALFLVGIITRSVGVLGADILTTGFIGLLMFGKLGAAAGALIPIIQGIWRVGRDMANSIVSFMAANPEISGAGFIALMLFGPRGLNFVQWVESTLNEVLGKVAVFGRKILSFLGLDDLASSIAGALGPLAGSGPGPFGRAAAGMMAGAQGSVDFVQDRFMKGIGLIRDAMGGQTDEVLANSDAWKGVQDAIDQMIKSMPELSAEIADGTKNSRAQATARRAERAAIKDTIDAIKAKIEVQRIENQIAEMQRDMQSPIFSSEFIDRARQVQEQAAVQMLEIQARIEAARREMVGVDDPTQLAAFNAQIEALQLLEDQFQRTAETATAQGMLIKETWAGIGDTITSTAKSALSSFVQGTFDAKEAGRALFSTLTDLAASYLVELIKIRLIQAAAGGGGGPIGAVGAALFGGGFANGGIVPGGTGLGNSIVRGPTFFAAGEGTEDEIILPMSKARRLAGAGGGEMNVNLSITALDTQSAMSVVLDTAPQLGQALSGVRNLEMGTV